MRDVLHIDQGHVSAGTVKKLYALVSQIEGAGFELRGPVAVEDYATIIEITIQKRGERETLPTLRGTFAQLEQMVRLMGGQR